MAEGWIAKHRLSGVLTKYRLDVGAYDWAVENGTFRPKKPDHFTPEFIGRFAGGETHFHYQAGERAGSVHDKDFFQRLRRDLEHQISGYVYEVPEGALGSPLPPEEIRALLNAMRLCLVEPNWEEVNICNTREESLTGAGVRRMCVTMAEDEGYALVFDPADEQYHLAWRSETGLATWGIRGDGVECFIAR